MARTEWVVAAAAVLGAAASTPALAQDGGVNGHGFGMTAQDGDPRDPLTLERPGAMKAGSFFLAALFEYNDTTMQQLTRGSSPDPVERIYFDSMTAVNLAAGANVHDMLRVDLRMPIFLDSRGHSANSADEKPVGGGYGTLRAAVMFAPIQPKDSGGLGLGVVPWLELPTASAHKNMGYGKITGGAKLAATVEAGSLTLGADAGIGFRPKVAGYEYIDGADYVVGTIGAGYLFTEDIGINLEANFKPALRSAPEDPLVEIPTWIESPAEALASLKVRTEIGLNLTLGAAVGLDDGIGAANYRLFIGLGYARSPKGVVDTDGDGIIDGDDDCRTEPEVVNGYKDDDGCPDQLATLAVSATEGGKAVAGVPLSIDGAGKSQSVTSGAGPVMVADMMPGAYSVKATGTDYKGSADVDAAEGETAVSVPVVAITPGTLSVTAKSADGAAIPGAVVSFKPKDGSEVPDLALSAEGTGQSKLLPGPYQVFVEADGFGIFRKDLTIISKKAATLEAVLKKAKTEVKKERIDILEKVFFEQGSAVILAKSHALLDEVSNVLLRNEDILLVEVAGHTSSEGSVELNTRLSNDRAKAVRAYLIAKDVAADRLVAKGYASTVPLVKERTAADRSKNRRVEFVIQKRAEAEK